MDELVTLHNIGNKGVLWMDFTLSHDSVILPMNLTGPPNRKQIIGTTKIFES